MGLPQHGPGTQEPQSKQLHHVPPVPLAPRFRGLDRHTQDRGQQESPEGVESQVGGTPTFVQPGANRPNWSRLGTEISPLLIQKQFFLTTSYSEGQVLWGQASRTPIPEGDFDHAKKRHGDSLSGAFAPGCANVGVPPGSPSVPGRG